MAHARIAKFIARGADYFTAMLDNGAVRFGMPEFGLAFDFPADHADHQAVKALDVCSAEAEVMFDEFFERYIPLPTDGFRAA